MRFECDITGIDPQPYLLAFFRRILDQAAREVALDKTTIGRVIIVSDDRFGPAVRSIKPGEGHTNTETGVAGGKTIPRREGDRVVSDVVLWCDPLGALVEVLGDPPASSHWGVDQHRGLYVVCHEFGHARDHADRNDASDALDPRSGPFSIGATADFYGNIVLTEYAASRIAAPAMPAALFDDEVQEAGQRMLASQKLVNKCLDDPAALTRRALAHTVCQGAWAFMVELAKLYGHATGDAGRTEVVGSLERDLLDSAPLRAVLAAFGEAYPNWRMPTQIEQLTGEWQRYAGTFGVRFVERDGGPDDFDQVA